jgi:hypothetical protein
VTVIREDDDAALPQHRASVACAGPQLDEGRQLGKSLQRLLIGHRKPDGKPDGEPDGSTGLPTSWLTMPVSIAREQTPRCRCRSVASWRILLRSKARDPGALWSMASSGLTS